MSLSNNIKRIRLEKGLTQEQLAARLGVSAQAVSKWETSDTYPDGALLVPLAKELEASLDELFENDEVSLGDLANRISSLICKTPKEERFLRSHEIAWQIHRALWFSCGGLPPIKYDAEELPTRIYPATVLTDHGFTIASNYKDPFFALCPTSLESFSELFSNRELIQEIFSALSRKHTMDAVFYLYQRNWGYVFEKAVLAEQCKIPEDQIEQTISDLLMMQIVTKQDLTVNGEPCSIFYSKQRQELLALFLIAKDLDYKGARCMTITRRKAPFLNQ